VAFKRAPTPTNKGTRDGRRVAGGRLMALVVSQNAGAVGRASTSVGSGWPEEAVGDIAIAVVVVVLGCCRLSYCALGE
jgi:hypothetical protein